MDDGVPPPRAAGVARSLDSARPGQLMYIGSNGTVQHPIALTATAVAKAGVLAIGFSVVTSWMFGPFTGTVLAAPYLLWQLGAAMTQAQALQRFAADDLRETETLARRAGSMPLVSGLLRGTSLNLATSAAWLQGKHQEALVLARKAIVILERSLARDARAHLVLAILNEVQLIALTGDPDGAYQRLTELDERGFAATGDLIAVQRIDTELVLAFEVDDPTRLPDDLDEWTQTVVRTNRFGSTLVLLAWVLRGRGEDELADALLETAADRLGECHIDRAHPRLHAWYQDAVGAAP